MSFVTSQQAFGWGEVAVVRVFGVGSTVLVGFLTCFLDLGAAARVIGASSDPDGTRTHNH